MIKVALLVIVICPLATPTFAIPENITIGPYGIYFDMGFEDYYFTEDTWKATETLRGEKFEKGSISIYKNREHMGNLAMIYIQQNEKEQDYVSAFNEKDIPRTIDQVLGKIASYPLNNGITIYMAQYRPSFDPKRINVTILSNYPWDEGTLQLLKTIHVEKVNR